MRTRELLGKLEFALISKETRIRDLEAEVISLKNEIARLKAEKKLSIEGEKS